MADPFLGEIRQFSFPFAPRGWAFCDGALLPINQNQALYSLLGTQFGGNGINTFGLPDLRGRVPVHVGNNITLGMSEGAETHTLTMNELPAHSHFAKGHSATGDQKVSADKYWAQASLAPYGATADAVMSTGALSYSGSSLPHNNMQPYSVVNFCIAVTGIFPTRS